MDVDMMDEAATGLPLTVTNTQRIEEASALELQTTELMSVAPISRILLKED